MSVFVGGELGGGGVIDIFWNNTIWNTDHMRIVHWENSSTTSWGNQQYHNNKQGVQFYTFCLSVSRSVWDHFVQKNLPNFNQTLLPKVHLCCPEEKGLLINLLIVLFLICFWRFSRKQNVLSFIGDKDEREEVKESITNLLKSQVHVVNGNILN